MVTNNYSAVNDIVTDVRAGKFAKDIEVSPELKKDKELRAACAGFEGMFLEMMMKTMREATKDSGLIKKSNGEKIFTGMLDQQYVDIAAKSGKTGLGEELYKYIKSTVPEYREKGNNFPPTGDALEMNRFLNSSKKKS